MVCDRPHRFWELYIKPILIEGGGGRLYPPHYYRLPPEYLDSPTALPRELTWSYYEEQLLATLSSVYAVLKNL